MATVFLLFSMVVLVLFITWKRGFSRKRLIGEPPLVNGSLPFIGITLDYARNPLGFLKETKKRHGNIFTCEITGKYYTFVTDPFSVYRVVRQSQCLDFNEFAVDFSRRVFGHADFNSPLFRESYTEVHSIFRQTLQGPALQQLSQSMLGNLQAVLERILPPENDWQEEGLQSFTNRIMFEAGFLTLFGKDLVCPHTDRIKPCMRQALKDFLVFDHAFPALAAGFPIWLYYQAWRARGTLTQEFLHDKLNHRKCISDLIQRRIDAFDRMCLDETGKASTHVCMLWASQANTLPASFWSLYYTLRSSEAQMAARAEINKVLSDQILNSPEEKIQLSKEQLDTMTVLGSIIEEALRLSSASIMIRVAKENFVLRLETGGSAAIRKGDYIALYPQLIHLDPDIYPDPTEFKYNRFLDETNKPKRQFFKNGQRLKHFLMPFGSGSSECPGRFFAVNEIKMFLVLVLWHYDLHLIDPDSTLFPDQTRAGLGILPPSQDITIKYRRRCKRV